MYMTADELTAFQAAHPHVDTLDVMVIDLCGNAIGKRLPMEQAPGILAKGTPVCGAMQLVDVMGNTADPMGYGFSDGDPDGMARPLAGTVAPEGGENMLTFSPVAVMGSSHHTTRKPFYVLLRLPWM